MTLPTTDAPSSNWKKLQKTLPVSPHGRKRKREPVEDSAPASAPSTSRVSTANPLTNGSNADLGKYVALDCEFVGVGMAGTESMLARVSIVNFHGHMLLDTFVQPKERVTDYRTWVSGVTEADLKGEGSRPLSSFEDVQKQVADLLKGRILVGHAVGNDLKCLMLSHPRAQTRDTATYGPLQEIAKTKHPSLRKLAKLVLGLEIQSDLASGHSSVEDAKATMSIYRAHKSQWEASLHQRAPSRTSQLRQSQTMATVGSGRDKKEGSRGKEHFKQKRTLNLSAALEHADEQRWPSHPGKAVNGKQASAEKSARPAVKSTQWWTKM